MIAIFYFFLNMDKASPSFTPDNKLIVLVYDYFLSFYFQVNSFLGKWI